MTTIDKKSLEALKKDTQIFLDLAERCDFGGTYTTLKVPIYIRRGDWIGKLVLEHRPSIDASARRYAAKQAAKNRPGGSDEA